MVKCLRGKNILFLLELASWSRKVMHVLFDGAVCSRKVAILFILARGY